MPKQPTLIFLSLLLTLPFFANALQCGKLEKQKVTYYDTLQNKNVTRNYYIYLPTQYCNETTHPPRAVIFGLHGYYGTASGYALSTTDGAINKLAEKENLIAVYPQGMMLNPKSNNTYTSWNFLSPQHYNSTHQSDTVVHNNKLYNICDIEKMQYNPIPKQPGCVTWHGICAWTSCYDDPSYILEVQKQVENKQNGNPHQQYITGFSNGAMMVYRMACQYPGKFQAAVSVGGTTARHMYCHHNNKHGDISYLIMTGKNDRVVPITPHQESITTDNTYYYEHASELTKTWSKDLNCHSSKKVIDNPNILDGIHCVEYNHCGDSKDNTIAYCIWGMNPDKTMDRRHNYPGAKYGTGLCVNKAQHQKIAYPVCQKKPVPESAMDGTRFIYNFFQNKKIIA